ncbi:MAG: hypothetical protein U5L45_17445 [Saprospiraceae bacterium]|nr:hypothetical protein [Saprospiraceae bacterium]
MWILKIAILLVVETLHATSLRYTFMPRVETLYATSLRGFYFLKKSKLITDAAAKIRKI